MKPKITIEFSENNECLFTVSHDNKKAIDLGYDEMLGLLTSLTMPNERPCQQWLWTKEQYKAWESKYKK